MLKKYVAAYREQLGETITPNIIDFTKTVTSPDPKRWSTGYVFLNQMKDFFIKSSNEGDVAKTKLYMESHRGWFIEYGKQYFKSAYGHITDVEKLFNAVTPNGDLCMFRFSNLAVTMGSTESGLEVTLIARYDNCIEAVREKKGVLMSPSEFEMISRQTLPRNILEELLNIKKSNDYKVFTGRDEKGNLVVENLNTVNKTKMFDWMMPIK